MEAVKLSFVLRPRSRIRNLFLWHAVRDGDSRTICGVAIPLNNEFQKAWDQTVLEPRCQQCVRRTHPG